MYRPHPLYLFYDIKKWLILLLLPIIRAIFSRQDTITVILSSIRDVLLATALVCYSIIKWQRAQYSLKKGLTLQHGIFYQRTLHVLSEDAASIEVENSPLMWLTRGRRVRINTAGLRKRADATIYLPTSATKSYLYSTANQPIRRYAARVLPVIIMSASSSNAALGLLTLAPLIRQSGQILGHEITGAVYGLVDRIVSLGLPPLLNTIADILVIGWCFAFVRTFTRTAGFYTERSEQQLHLISGLLTQRDIYIDCSRITTLELRQTLFMRLFRLYSVIITAAGYGREKGARPIIIPAARPKELRNALNTLLPEYPTCSKKLCPVKIALFSYVLLPLLLIILSIRLLMLGGMWNMISAICFLIGSWWLLIRLIGYTKAGFGVNSRAVTLRYSRGLALYEIHIPREVADCAFISRNIWQRLNGTCTVELRCFGEKRRRHRVYALPYKQARLLIEQLANT